MHYPISKKFTLDGYEVGWNPDISPTDREYAGRAYPPFNDDALAISIKTAPSTTVRGAAIVTLFSNSPLERLVRTDGSGVPGSAEQGDVITAVNGKPVWDTDSYKGSVAGIGGYVIVKIFSKRFGNEAEWQVGVGPGINPPPPGPPAISCQSRAACHPLGFLRGFAHCLCSH